MRNSFDHQPEAQHPKLFSYPQAAGRLPIFDAYCGLRSDIARGPKSAANSRHHHARFE